MCDGVTVLLFSNHEAKDGKNKSLRFMLEHGADPDTRDQRFGTGSTPLHGAARHDRLNAANTLLEFGADVNAKNDDGLTPLGLTKHSKKGKVIELLKANGGKYST